MRLKKIGMQIFDISRYFSCLLKRILKKYVEDAVNEV